MVTRGGTGKCIRTWKFIDPSLQVIIDRKSRPCHRERRFPGRYLTSLSTSSLKMTFLRSLVKIVADTSKKKVPFTLSCDLTYLCTCNDNLSEVLLELEVQAWGGHRGTNRRRSSKWSASRRCLKQRRIPRPLRHEGNSTVWVSTSSFPLPWLFFSPVILSIVNLTINAVTFIK